MKAQCLSVVLLLTSRVSGGFAELARALADLPGGAIVREDGRIGGCFEEWEAGVCIQALNSMMAMAMR